MNINELIQILSKELPHDKRRIAWLAELMQALYIGKTTNLSKLARVLGHGSKIQSRYRRTQRFLDEFKFEVSDCAAIVMSLLDWGSAKPYLLMDRTEWEYGQTWINILVVAIAYKGIAIPLGWVLLPGRGNSSRAARIGLLEAIFDRIGIERFGGLLADREFIGEEWFAYLIERQLPFYIRIKEGANTKNSRGQSVAIGWLFHHLKWGEQEQIPGLRNIYRHELKIWGARSPVDGELMIVVSNETSKNNIEAYLQRWGIETLFGNLKSRGFDFEATHVVDHGKINCLILVLTLAYVWALKVGIFINRHVKVVPRKKHGRNLYSLFRIGMDFLCEALITSSSRAIKIALKILNCEQLPPLRAQQVCYLRSFVMY